MPWVLLAAIAGFAAGAVVQALPFTAFAAASADGHGAKVDPAAKAPVAEVMHCPLAFEGTHLLKEMPEVVQGCLPLLQAGRRRPRPVSPLRRHRPRRPFDRGRILGFRRHFPQYALRRSKSTGTTTSMRSTPACSRASSRPVRRKRRRWRRCGLFTARSFTLGRRARRTRVALPGCSGPSRVRSLSSSHAQIRRHRPIRLLASAWAFVY